MSKEQNHPPRGFVNVTYSGLAVVGLAALTLVGASASASAASHDTEGARSASAASRTGERGQPPFATKAEARRVARRWLAKVVLPAGTSRLTGKHVPAAIRQPIETIGATSYLDVHELFTSTESAREVVKFLAHHHPAGTTRTGTIKTYNDKNGKVTDLKVGADYSPKHLGAAFNEIDILVEVVAGPHDQALIRADVQVVWYPRRSAAEHLVASDFKAVTIHATFYGTGVTNVTRTFRQAALIDKLTRVLNSEPASPGGFESCPAIFAVYTLTFKPVSGQAGATVSAQTCPSYGVTVGGQPQPALVDGGGVETIAGRVMDAPSPGSSGSSATSVMRP
jgi:hypothetical protein